MQHAGTSTLKTTAVWPLTFHLTNHLSKMSKTCWALPKK